jgi:hypothetical protein
VVGNGKKVMFWEDTWFGSAPLVVQFWELYSKCNKKTKNIAEVWVEGELRLSFRRSFSEEMLFIWEELRVVAEQISITDESDALIWGCERIGVYSSHSFYAIINYMGVTPVYIPVVWSVSVPPKIQLFLWLLVHNKLATIDNLNRKGMSKPTQCCFCAENESIDHLFFECVVAKEVWRYVCSFLGIDIGNNYLSAASRWLSKEKCYSVNIIFVVAMRSIWLTRTDFIFHKQEWVDVKTIARRMLKLTLEWNIMVKKERKLEMDKWLSFLE